MKQLSFLLGLSFLLTFLSGSLLLFVQKDYRKEISLEQIENAKSEIKRNVKTFHLLSADSILTEVYDNDLVDPKSHLPQSLKYDIKELRQLKSYSNNCDENLINWEGSRELKKTWDFQVYLCKKIPQLLRGGFFESGQSIHPFGGSFAFHLYKSGRKEYQSLFWLIDNFKYFHILEWKKLPEEVLVAKKSSKVVKSLLDFDLNHVSDLYHRLPIILSKRYLFIIEDGKAEQNVYKVYERKEMRKSLENYGLKLRRFNSSQACSFREGNYCWEKNSEQAFKNVNYFVLGILGIVFLLLMTTTKALIKKLKNRERDRERKGFILRTIAHEIRTPITATRLAINNIKKSFDRLDKEQQELFLDILSQMSRLNAVVEKSQQYLSSSNHKVLDLKYQRVSSMKEFFHSILETYLDNGLDFYLEEDFSFNCDPYWLGIVIKNIVENAYKHGKAPVSFRCLFKVDEMTIEIRDQGEIQSLDNIFEAFEKNNSSDGLGLGLHLSQSIVKAFQGRIILKTNPTCVQIKIKDREKA